jgi:D-alanyl-D-alanine carboxypeptidase (penicillin-binding protein 5/6)
MGAETAGGRNDDALKLLGYGFKNFAVRTLIKEGESVGEVEAPNGDPPALSLVAAKSLIVTVRKGMEESIPLRKEIPSSVNPPISQGGVIGKLVLEGEGFPAEEIDLVAAHDVRVKSYAAYYLIVLAVVGGLFGFFLWRRQGFKKRTRR